MTSSSRPQVLFLGCTIPARAQNFEMSARKVAATLGIGLIPVVSQLTSYYQVILLGYALLLSRREAAVMMLLGLAALSQVVPLPWDGIDEVYTALGVATLVFVFAVTALFAPIAL